MKDLVSAIIATQDQFLTLLEMEGDERRADDRDSARAQYYRTVC